MDEALALVLACEVAAAAVVVIPVAAVVAAEAEAEVVDDIDEEVCEVLLSANGRAKLECRIGLSIAPISNTQYSTASMQRIVK